MLLEARSPGRVSGETHVDIGSVRAGAPRADGATGCFHGGAAIRRRDRGGPCRDRPRCRPLTGIQGRLLDADGHDQSIDLAGGMPKVKRHQLVWVDADLESAGAVDDLVALLELSDRTRRRLERDASLPAIMRSTGSLHLTMEALEPEDPDLDLADDAALTAGKRGRLVRRRVDLISVPGAVATIRRGRVAAIERYERSLADETSLGSLDPNDLMSAIIDEIINGYFMVVAGIEREIDALDHRALRGARTQDILGGIVDLRRRVNQVRRVLAPHRGVIQELVGPQTRADVDLGQPWPGLAGRIETAVAATEALRDALLGTYDIHMGRATQRANEVMLALTMLSAVLLPAVVLAGIMGMNFQLAFFDQPENFFLVLAAMIAFAIGLLALARLRRWI